MGCWAATRFSLYAEARQNNTHVLVIRVLRAHHPTGRHTDSPSSPHWPAPRDISQKPRFPNLPGHSGAVPGSGNVGPFPCDQVRSAVSGNCARRFFRIAPQNGDFGVLTIISRPKSPNRLEALNRQGLVRTGLLETRCLQNLAVSGQLDSQEPLVRMAEI